MIKQKEEMGDVHITNDRTLSERKYKFMFNLFFCLFVWTLAINPYKSGI